jgi:poly(3-hydroxybutyrate) depolymerase
MKTMMRKMVHPITEVIDFERTNRIPEIKGLEECRKEIMPGITNIWYEYVPKSYKGDKVPLVIQVHGGGNDGRRWAGYTLWHELADRNGMIVIYPNSPEYGCWPCEDEDIKYVYDLIQHMCEKYAIDTNRIYMQGMSNGDMMTLAFSMRYPNVLAAAGYITGPSAEEVLDGDRPTGPVPIIQMRGEHDVNWRLTPETIDVYEMRYSINDLNRQIWEEVNGTQGEIPALSIEGKDNYLYYKGKNATIINWEIQGMGHREPAYSAQILWDKLYSGCKRENEKIVIDNSISNKQADEDVVIIAVGSNKAYSKGKIISINDLQFGTTRIALPADSWHFCPVKLDEMCETEVMCAPVEFFERVYGAEITYNETRDKVVLNFANGVEVKLMEDSLLLEVNGRYMAMQKPCFLRCGVFYVPVAEFCQMILNKQISVADDVMCISEHYAVLGKYTARVIRELLGGTMRPRTRD